MKFKAVLFDMDGVLIDSEGYYGNGTFTWMKNMGFKGTIEDVYRVIGTTMEGTYKILYELMEGRVSLKELQERNENYFLENPLPYSEILKEGVIEICTWLKENKIKIAVCSSSSRDNIMQALSACDVYHYFDFITSGEDFKESKPNPEIYLNAAEKLGVNIEDCIVVEDSTLGIKAGKNANMRVIAIRDTRFNLNQEEADIIVDSMWEVASILKEN